MNKPELLAPVGNLETLKYAIMAGCDAVYLGGKKFGARAFSKNFTDEEMIEAINYCHLYGVKIYVTCNTIIYEDEVEDFINYARFLHQNNVDALIVQDLGMINLLNQKFPNLEVHSSTQAHIHNLDGAIMMESLGIKRVVVARETSIDTIKEIKKHTNLEVEAFIHGSLCVSYSGECLMSSFIGKRSGNRGECAGSCRLPYDVLDENNNILNPNDKYPLSMKDLCTIYNLDKIIDAGTDSLKIEGRMKSKEYVYLVVKLYREAIDSYFNNHKITVNLKTLNDLKKTFNREYTEGFILNTNNKDVINMKQPNNIGILIGKVTDTNNKYLKIKLNDELHIEDGLRVLSKTPFGIKVNEFYKDKNLVKVAYKDDVISIKAYETANIGDEVYLTSSPYILNKIDEEIKNNPKKINININLTCKIGQPIKITVTDNKNTITKEDIILEEANNFKTTKEVLLEKLNKLGNTIYNINKINIDIDENVFVPLKVLNDLRRNAILELDNLRIGKSNFTELNEHNLEIKELNYNEKISTNIISKVIDSYDTYDLNNRYLVSELGALNKLKNIDTYYTFNVVNSYTVALLHSLGVKIITLSLELSPIQIKKIVDEFKKRYNILPNLCVYRYGNPIVMTLKFNMKEYFNKDNLRLRDRLNNIYKVEVKDDLTYIYFCKKIDLRNVDFKQMGITNYIEN